VTKAVGIKKPVKKQKPGKQRVRTVNVRDEHGMFNIGSHTWPGVSKVIEEAGEVIQVAGKLLATGGDTRHWDGQGSLRSRLQQEVADLQAALDFVCEVNKLKTKSRRARKLALFRKWQKKNLTEKVRTR
jgi:hypothetical protein